MRVTVTLRIHPSAGSQWQSTEEEEEEEEQFFGSQKSDKRRRMSELEEEDFESPRVVGGIPGCVFEEVGK